MFCLFVLFDGLGFFDFFFSSQMSSELATCTNEI